MSSTNKTANLGLPQWAESDPVEREDFNSCISMIDDAIGRKRLFDFIVAEQAQLIQLDLSGIDLDNFAELELYLYVKDKNFYMRFNEYAESNYECLSYNSSRSRYDKISIHPLTVHIVMGKERFYAVSEMSFWRYEMDRSTLPRINTVELFYTGDTTFDKGDRVTVWGVLR